MMYEKVSLEVVVVAVVVDSVLFNQDIVYLISLLPEPCPAHTPQSEMMDDSLVISMVEYKMSVLG